MEKLIKSLTANATTRTKIVLNIKIYVIRIYKQ